MKAHVWIIAASFAVVGASANAACPSQSPRLSWNSHSADTAVNDAFLQKRLVGARVEYTFNGTKSAEVYGADGSYVYSDPSGSYRPKSYRFYRDGVRCLDYPNGPRFDKYVVSNDRLVLINRQGGRFEGRIRK